MASVTINTLNQKAEAAKELEKFLKKIKPDRIDAVYYRATATPNGKGIEETVTVTFTDRNPIEVCVNLDSVEALVLDVINSVIYK